MKQRVKEILAEIKETPGLAQTLSDNADILQDARMDSLQLVDFVLKIEDEFGVEFDFDTFDMSILESIDAFCQFIAQEAGDGRQRETRETAR